MNVERIQAHWRDSGPGGLMVVLDFEGKPGAGEHVCRQMESQLAGYDRRATPELVVGRLAEFAARKGGPTQEERVSALFDVYWLERRGHLQPDEYNGLLFVWVHAQTIVSSEQNPILLDPDRAIREGVDETAIAKALPTKGAVDALIVLREHERSRRRNEGR